jgi:hypothetical protein
MDRPPTRYQNPSVNSSMNKVSSIQALSSITECRQTRRLETCRSQQIWKYQRVKKVKPPTQQVLNIRVRTHIEGWVQYVSNQTLTGFRKQQTLSGFEIEPHQNGHKSSATQSQIKTINKQKKVTSRCWRLKTDTTRTPPSTQQIESQTRNTNKNFSDNTTTNDSSDANYRSNTVNTNNTIQSSYKPITEPNRLYITSSKASATTYCWQFHNSVQKRLWLKTTTKRP